MSFDALFAEAELDDAILFLDVHGLSREAANDAIDLFLDRAFCAGEKCVKVVHGKGLGILQTSTQRFLKQHAQVAAIHTSLRQEEIGAVVYVALKGRV